MSYMVVLTKEIPLLYEENQNSSDDLPKTEFGIKLVQIEAFCPLVTICMIN